MNDATNIPTGPIPGVHTYAGDCPICGQSIMAEQRQLPHLCPTCSHPLRSADPNSPWRNVQHALRLYFDPRGRATRREFWAFTLTALLLLADMLHTPTLGINPVVVVYSPSLVETPQMGL